MVNNNMQKVNRNNKQQKSQEKSKSKAQKITSGQSPIPPNQLLQALNSLQHSSLCYEEELSFGQPSSHDHHMQFEIYMQRKQPKSVTPIKNSSLSARKNTLKHTLKHNNNKSTHQHQSSLTPKKQLCRTIHAEKENLIGNGPLSSSTISQKTKKILTQQQKKGKSYVPIQHRAEQLLRQRQAKLAKLKEQKELAQTIEEKQCTFKPKLTHKYSHVASRLLKSTLNQSSMQETGKKDKKEENLEENFEEGPPEGVAEQPGQLLETAAHRKYKNQKFNILLDFLH